MLALSMLPSVAFAAPIFSPTPTLSGGTLIDFEGQANGINADNLYAGLGVTFGSARSNTRIWNPPSAGNQTASSGTGVLGPREADSDPISIFFAAGQSFVEFFLGEPSILDGTFYTLTAYDAANVVLESFVIESDDLPGDYYVGFSRGAAEIRRISIDPSNGAEDFSIDDLRFGVAAVPEPATLALVALGLGLLAARRKQPHPNA